MATMTRRLQLLLDEERYGRVLSSAAARNLSVAAVIRAAIDESVPLDRPDKRAAYEAILAAEPMDVPEAEELVEEIKRSRDERLRDIS